MTWREFDKSLGREHMPDLCKAAYGDDTENKHQNVYESLKVNLNRFRTCNPQMNEMEIKKFENVALDQKKLYALLKNVKLSQND